MKYLTKIKRERDEERKKEEKKARKERQVRREEKAFVLRES
jgi:hypothetical protein